jgi:CRP-like cAMP-binding protein
MNRGDAAKMEVYMKYSGKRLQGMPPAISADDCLAALLEDERQALIDNRKEIVFEAGESIIKEGFVASNVLYLEEGLVRLDALVDGRHSTVNLVSPHSFVGLICTFASHNLMCSARALEPSRVSLIDLELFEHFVRQNGTFAVYLTRHISAVTSRIVHRLARLKDKHIDGALSVLLLEFAEIYQSMDYTVPLNRKEIADMLGYSKESVINALSRMHREGIVKVKGRKIGILRKDTLRKISQTG